MTDLNRTSLLACADQFISQNLGPAFHDKLLLNLGKLKLQKLLRRKNPYLFRAKAIENASELVRLLLDAYLSSQEETIFGDFLEALAICVCAQAYGGRKSTAEGIDLEFERDGKRYVVAIKSGPNWANSQQLKRLKANFAQVRKIAGRQVMLEAVNGCCYGRETSMHKGEYLKLCGQEFWALISGLDDFYLDIVEPLGRQAKTKTDEFKDKYAATINRFALEFIQNYCTQNGTIDWVKLLAYNSGRAT